MPSLFKFTHLKIKLGRKRNAPFIILPITSVYLTDYNFITTDGYQHGIAPGYEEVKEYICKYTFANSLTKIYYIECGPALKTGHFRGFKFSAEFEK